MDFKTAALDAWTSKADVTFRCDKETFFHIAFGRLSIDAAIAADRLVPGHNGTTDDCLPSSGRVILSFGKA